MPFLRYVIILVLLYILYRLIKATVRELLVNMGVRRQTDRPDSNNVHGGKKADINDIPEAKYEEIKDETTDRKN
jgi:hypothetical protein